MFTDYGVNPSVAKALFEYTGIKWYKWHEYVRRV